VSLFQRYVVLQHMMYLISCKGGALLNMLLGRYMPDIFPWASILVMRMCGTVMLTARVRLGNGWNWRQGSEEEIDIGFCQSL
jgi:hypothetical protein